MTIVKCPKCSTYTGIETVYHECHHCKTMIAADPIEHERANSLTILHNTAAWAIGQLRILSEMAQDNKLPPWYVAEVKRIKEGLEKDVVRSLG